MNETPFHLKLKDRLGRIFPAYFWKRYDSLARQQGFDRLYLLLSFDCDTPEDALTASTLDEWLYDHSIQRSYAVPGCMLAANPAIYQAIAAKGAEFLNHGYLPHTQMVDGVFRSTTFYAEMEPAAVEEDVRKGHETVCKILGRKPAGFRAPHFGLISLNQKEENIQPVLRDIGEYYSSHTTPFEAIQYGPVWWKNNWPEFPVCGSTVAPFSILDSFTYLQSPAIRKVTTQFSAVLKQTIRQLHEWQVYGLLNIYVDPSHVAEDAGFLEAMQLTRDLGIPSLTYTQSLEIGSQDAGE